MMVDFLKMAETPQVLSCTKRFTCVILHVDLGIKVDVWIVVLLNLS